MPALAQSLQGQDLGHLQIIAEHWGLELHAPDVLTALEILIPHMLERQRFDEVFETFPENAHQALQALMHNGGRLPWQGFIRRFGVVREMGPGRRDRQRPDRQPASPAEVLWYHALMARAFFDTPSGPEEYAYIPDELMALLPVPQGDQMTPLGRPATPAERSNPIPTSDRILDDACTLLAALRLGLPDEALSFDFASPYPLSPFPLKALLFSAGLLDPGGLPLPEPTRAFLEASRGEALAQLVSAWQDSTDFNELAFTPGLILEGDWLNDPRRARRAILDFLASLPLASLPGDTWWNLEAFVTAIHQYHPDYQRPAGDYDTWIIRRRDSPDYLRGFEHWDQVDGALIRFLIGGPLYWLGIADLATLPDSLTVSAFRFSPWSEALLDGLAPVGPPLEDGLVQVRSDGRLRLPRLTPRAVRYQISRFCEWEGEVDQVYRYRLTPVSLERARQQGLQLSHLLALLGRHAKTVPPVLVKALKRWEERGVEARLEPVLVLRLSSPEVLQALRASRAARFLGDPLGPSAVIVKPGAREKVLAAILELGYLVEELL